MSGGYSRLVRFQPAEFENRREAGRRLGAVVAEELGGTVTAPVVLGVVRGGVPVAAEVAAALGAELGVAFATKIGAPGNPELAVGALADDEALIDPTAIRRLRVSSEHLDAEIQRRREALEQKRRRFADHLVEVGDRNVVVVDDGVATGHTLEAVIRSVQRAGATSTIVAVPVGPPSTIERLARVADRAICPMQPEPFYAVGAWYREFPQLDDADVLRALETPGQ